MNFRTERIDMGITEIAPLVVLLVMFMVVAALCWLFVGHDFVLDAAVTMFFIVTCFLIAYTL